MILEQADDISISDYYLEFFVDMVGLETEKDIFRNYIISTELYEGNNMM